MAEATEGVLKEKKPKRTLAETVNLWFLCGGLIYLAFLLYIFGFSIDTYRVAIVAVGGVSIGAALGFLYSSFGEEKTVFSSVAVGINGLIGGVTLADLTNPDGVIRGSLTATAVACGLPESSSPLIAFILITSAVLGFGAVYMLRHLTLNKAIDSSMQSFARKGVEAAPPPIDPENKSSNPTPETRILTQAPGAGVDGTSGKLLADAMAFYQEGNYARAIEILEQRVLTQSPSNTDALLYLASSQIAENREFKPELYRKPLEILEKLITLQNPPITAFKLLGYVLLFHPETAHDYKQKLLDSVRYTEIYLKAFPDDPWAKLNLACAYGQMGPQDAAARAKLIPLIRELASIPEVKIKIVAFKAAGESFSDWAGDKEFEAALQEEPPASP
jgi:hypothetical protein